jgi:hypothetical protein
MGFTRWFLWFMMAVVFAWTVGFWFAQVFTCGTHFFAIWGSVQDLVQYCVKTLKKQYALAMSSFIIDAIILIIPLPLVRAVSFVGCLELTFLQVWRLHLQPKKKVAVSLVFLLGFG